MKRLIFIAFVLFCFSLGCKKSASDPVVAVQPPPDDAVRLSLSKGINLSNWFNDYSDPAQFGTRFSAADFQKIKALGFTHVRIPIGSTILYQESNPSQLNTRNLAFVTDAIKKATDAGVAVVIDPLHECCDEFVEKKLATDATYVTRIAAYWKAVAGQFKSYPADKVFFEVFNEPHVATSKAVAGIAPAWWLPVQEKLAQAIREVDTNHYIIVGGEGWNGIDGLKAMTPYNLPRLVYNFHFYSPFTFTHQGATWAGNVQAQLHDVPYPSAPENVAPLIAAATDADVKNTLKWYGDSRYDSGKLEQELLQAVNWGKLHNVILTCNEFGSYKPFAPRQSRLNCLTDVRTLLEKYQIGWAMWEFDEGFGIIDYTNNDRTKPVTDTGVTQALGLK